MQVTFANQIYYGDETGFSTVHKSSNIISQKDKDQVGALTNGERALTTTGVCCMKAAGEFILTLIIFKRGRMNDWIF